MVVYDIINMLNKRKMLNKIYRSIFPAQEETAVKKQYGIPSQISLTLELKDGCFVITSPDLPGFITQARNSEELLDMVNDAVLTYYDVPKRVSDFVYNKIDIHGIGTFSYAEKRALQTN